MKQYNQNVSVVEKLAANLIRGAERRKNGLYWAVRPGKDGALRFYR